MAEFKKMIMQEFEMTDLGELSYFLDIEVKTSEWIFMHQKKYAKDILKRFNMSECNPIITLVETGISVQLEGGLPCPFFELKVLLNFLDIRKKIMKKEPSNLDERKK